MCYHLFIQYQEMYVMDPDKMSPTQYFVQKIIEGYPVEPLAEIPLGPSLSDLLNTALGQRDISVAAAAELLEITKRQLWNKIGEYKIQR